MKNRPVKKAFPHEKDIPFLFLYLLERIYNPASCHNKSPLKGLAIRLLVILSQHNAQCNNCFWRNQYCYLVVNVSYSLTQNLGSLFWVSSEWSKLIDTSSDNRMIQNPFNKCLSLQPTLNLTKCFSGGRAGVAAYNISARREGEGLWLDPDLIDIRSRISLCTEESKCN